MKTGTVSSPQLPPPPFYHCLTWPITTTNHQFIIFSTPSALGYWSRIQGKNFNHLQIQLPFNAVKETSSTPFSPHRFDYSSIWVNVMFTLFKWQCTKSDSEKNGQISLTPFSLMIDSFPIREMITTTQRRNKRIVCPAHTPLFQWPSNVIITISLSTPSIILLLQISTSIIPPILQPKNQQKLFKLAYNHLQLTITCATTKFLAAWITPLAIQHC